VTPGANRENLSGFSDRSASSRKADPHMAKTKKESGRKRSKTNRLKASLRRKRTKQVLRNTGGERKYSS
jgi:hypothetical protein